MNLKLKFLLLIVSFWTISGVSQNAYYLKKIRFSGNQAFSKTELSHAMRAHERRWYHRLPLFQKAKQFPQTVLERDALRLTKFYHSEGFFNAEVELSQFKPEPNQETAIASFLVRENEPALIDTVVFKINGSDTTKCKELDLAFCQHSLAHSRFRELELKQFTTQIQNELLSNGFAFSEVKSEIKFHDNKSRIVLNFNITFGDICKFDSVSISGLEKISETTVRQEVTVQPGTTFDFRKLRESQLNLFFLDLFRYVNVVPDLSVARVDVPIQIYVKERKQTSLRLGLGYGSEDQIRSMFELKKRSFLGGARILTASGKHSKLGFNFQTNFLQPNFLMRRLNFTLGSFYRYDDELNFNVSRRGFFTNFNRKQREELLFDLNYRLEYAQLDAPEQLIQEELPFGQTRYFKSIVKWSARRQILDNLLDPTQGHFEKISIENSHRISGKAYEFWKLQAEWRQFLKAGQRNVLGMRLMSGAIFPTGAGLGVPFEERFFAGGSNSVRGYARHFLGPLDTNREPTGGNGIVEGSFELRTRIFNVFSTAIFYDFGNIWSHGTNIKFVELEDSFGFGIRIKTPVGPIRADVGFKSLTSHGQFHLSVGQAF